MTVMAWGSGTWGRGVWGEGAYPDPRSFDGLTQLTFPHLLASL